MYKKLKIVLAALWIFVALFLTVVLFRGLEGGFDSFLVFNLKNPDKSILVENRESVITTSKGTSEIATFTEKISKAYDVPTFKQVFREINKSEAISDDRFDFDNPTSGNPTSTFK